MNDCPFRSSADGWDVVRIGAQTQGSTRCSLDNHPGNMYFVGLVFPRNSVLLRPSFLLAESVL